ncbi:hypothetical protein EIKCOROL_02217 [Eikenella corrodens ATCC 23834]|uniref:Uncharacterized protein n=1 Tax=Eikenella corrodens ATCC 23834 TaxID=546274 RepID=C0DXV5_EIKCO|nr:hypothetical protein EIKCOROL_02217 [Eikenella corrodens ATCC 23834]
MRGADFSIETGSFSGRLPESEMKMQQGFCKAKIFQVASI